MKHEPLVSRGPAFWQTVRLLLSASHRRAAGRSQRQQQLLQFRTGSKTSAAGAFSTVVVWLGMMFVNWSAAYVVQLATSQALRIEAERYGKVVVSSHFLDAITELESAASETEKKRAEE